MNKGYGLTTRPMLGHLGDHWIPKNQCSVANSCPAKSRIIPNGQRKSKKGKGSGATV
jgi:hypothetical protein